MARRFLEERHCPDHGAQVVDIAVLLVSELVSNAVRHGTPPVTLETECDSTHALAVRVSDASPRLPQSGDTAADDAETGRGLAILQILSDAWGVDPHRDGKTVWFRVMPPDRSEGEQAAHADGARPGSRPAVDVRDAGYVSLNGPSSEGGSYPTA